MTIANGGKPLGGRITELFCVQPTVRKLTLYRIFILLLTFISYACYHMSRKPISVVKTELIQCTNTTQGGEICESFISQINGTDEKEAKRLEGFLDTSYLFSYAIFMFVSGFIAERMDLRYFLSAGMFLSGVLTMLFGFGYFWGIHGIGYYIFVQILSGAFQSTGWPGVVTVVANWFGKGKKGLIFGIWNSHTSVGNILGSLLASAFVEDDWGLSFIVPGIIISVVGIFFFLFLIPKPEIVGLNVDLATPTDTNGIISETSPLLNDMDENEFANEDDDLEAGTSSKEDDDHKDHLPIHPNQLRRSSIISAFSTDTTLIEDIPEQHQEEHAISFLGALKIPGVVEFAMCLFFAKLVSYTFLYWLPDLIQENSNLSSQEAGNLSTLFDVGGIIGGILAGILSDMTGKSASTCAIMLLLAIPMLFFYENFSQECPIDINHKNHCYTGNVGLLLLLGLLVNGPYALITTAVSAELGTHPCLHGSSAALATVTAIIDGTGSIGAAVGPFLASAFSEYEQVFFMLMAADIFALLFLTRLVIRDVKVYIQRFRNRNEVLEES